MNKKVLAMYQAVVDLLEAGVDITTLKVADITKQAGIGKGTAYEYFSSKDEIIAKALRWDLQQQLEGIENSLKQVHSMKEQIFMGLNWIEQSVHRKSMVIHFMRASSKMEKLQNPCEYVQDEGMHEVIYKLCDLVLKQGEAEGVISPTLPEFMKHYVLISNCIGFFMMVNQTNMIPGMNPAELKHYIYETMVKSLQ